MSKEVNKGENWRRGYMTGYHEGVVETAKAYGGCINCFGKGYSTHMQNEIGAEDFGGDGYEVGPRIHITFCRCSRGKQLRVLFGKATEGNAGGGAWSDVAVKFERGTGGKDVSKGRGGRK